MIQKSFTTLVIVDSRHFKTGLIGRKSK